MRREPQGASGSLRERQGASRRSAGSSPGAAFAATLVTSGIVHGGRDEDGDGVLAPVSVKADEGGRASEREAKGERERERRDEEATGRGSACLGYL